MHEIRSERKPEEEKLTKRVFVENDELEVSGFFNPEGRMTRMTRTEKTPPYFTVECKLSKDEELESLEAKDKSGRVWYFVNLAQNVEGKPISEYEKEIADHIRKCLEMTENIIEREKKKERKK